MLAIKAGEPLIASKDAMTGNNKQTKNGGGIEFEKMSRVQYWWYSEAAPQRRAAGRCEASPPHNSIVRPSPHPIEFATE